MSLSLEKAIEKLEDNKGDIGMYELGFLLTVLRDNTVSDKDAAAFLEKAVSEIYDLTLGKYKK